MAKKITLRLGDLVDPAGVTIEYEQREDYWYVKTPQDDEFWSFADSNIKEVTVKQLIRKKWDVGFGDPDPLEDRS